MTSTAHHQVEERLELEAGRRRRWKIREDFAWHFGTYLIMVGFFLTIALIVGGDMGWVLWIAAPWGLAVAFHAMATIITGTDLVHHHHDGAGHLSDS